MFDYLTILGWGVITNGWVLTRPPPSGILSNCILRVRSDLSDNKHACNEAVYEIIHVYVSLLYDKYYNIKQRLIKEQINDIQSN